jgi:prophage regulatory protein
MEAINQSPALLRRKDVEARTGLKRSKIYQLMTEGTFPSQVKLGVGSSVAWVDSEIEDWIQRQIDNGRNILTKQPTAAENFLREVLAKGEMVEPILRSRADAYGIAWSSIETARDNGIVTRETVRGKTAPRWRLSPRRET